MEVKEMQNSRSDRETEPKIYGVKICHGGNSGYCISVRHSGVFRLEDYAQIELEVSSVRLTRRT
jgi:hypothetical protein